jgi:hypothetical protein
MKRIAIALPLFLLATPAVAFTKRERLMYDYGYSYGWLANSCAQYVAGDIDASQFKEDIRRTKNKSKPMIWRAIVESFNKAGKGLPISKPCMRIVNQLDSDLL